MLCCVVLCCVVLCRHLILNVKYLTKQKQFRNTVIEHVKLFKFYQHIQFKSVNAQKWLEKLKLLICSCVVIAQIPSEWLQVFIKTVIQTLYSIVVVHDVKQFLFL